MPKWKVESVPDVVEGLVRHYVTDGERKFQIAQGTAVANQLSSLLNNLEEQNAAMQEERRWRKIGEEEPEPILGKRYACVTVGRPDCTRRKDYYFYPQAMRHGEPWLEYVFVPSWPGEDAGTMRTDTYTTEDILKQGWTHWRVVSNEMPKEEGNDAN